MWILKLEMEFSGALPTWFLLITFFPVDVFSMCEQLSHLVFTVKSILPNVIHFFFLWKLTFDLVLLFHHKRDCRGVIYWTTLTLHSSGLHYVWAAYELVCLLFLNEQRSKCYGGAVRSYIKIAINESYF